MAVVAAVLEERTTGLWWHKKRRETAWDAGKGDASGDVAMILKMWKDWHDRQGKHM